MLTAVAATIIVTYSAANVAFNEETKVPTVQSLAVFTSPLAAGIELLRLSAI